ncbi:hypothetical protein DNTS_005345 [Danionella cerebrum]|uniref:Uncharacterized protein n=1 Tax=Danionella cerebrum TaxID=2873325 RepID=A0A553MQW6_9TELE|nr:hypothetical protein DNTS_005345 [Danionella translucida]
MCACPCSLNQSVKRQFTNQRKASPYKNPRHRLIFLFFSGLTKSKGWMRAIIWKMLDEYNTLQPPNTEMNQGGFE